MHCLTFGTVPFDAGSIGFIAVRFRRRAEEGVVGLIVENVGTHFAFGALVRHPRVVEDLLDCGPLVRVDLKHLLDQAQSFRAHLAPPVRLDGVLTCQAIFVSF